MTSIDMGRYRPSHLKMRVRKWFNRKVDAMAVAFVAWLLSKPAVQNEVAMAFSSGTPMCQVLDRAIDSALEDDRRSVDAEDIHGLDKVIEEAVERNVEDALENATLTVSFK